MHPALEGLFERYPVLNACQEDTLRAFEMLRACYEGGGKVLICGNGGSAADSEHIVGELMKGFKLQRPVPAAFRDKLRDASPEGEALAAKLQGALPTLSLVSQTALITAYANDIAPEMIFAQQVYGYGKAGDVLVGISTSGNSTNVISALIVARALGMNTLGFSGEEGGKMVNVCDVTVRVPKRDTLEVQELQLPIYHALCLALEATFFAS